MPSAPKPPAPEVDLRPARRDDLAAIESLCRTLDPQDYGLLTWRDWLDRRECVNRVAVAGGRLVGCFHGRAVATAQAFIQVLRVDPDWRRRGLGSRLVAALERGLVERGVAVARCTTGVGNLAARRLFGAAGYRERLEVHRLRRPAGLSRAVMATASAGAAALARRHGLYASRPAPAHYLRVYWEPEPGERATEERRSRLVAAAGAVAWLDPAGHEGGPWITALAGPEEATPGLVETVGAGAPLTVDAPAPLAARLQTLGFAAPGDDDKYVLLEKRLAADG